MQGGQQQPGGNSPQASTFNAANYSPQTYTPRGYAPQQSSQTNSLSPFSNASQSYNNQNSLSQFFSNPYAYLTPPALTGYTQQIQQAAPSQTPTAETTASPPAFTQDQINQVAGVTSPSAAGQTQMNQIAGLTSQPASSVPGAPLPAAPPAAPAKPAPISFDAWLNSADSAQARNSARNWPNPYTREQDAYQNYLTNGNPP